ncbi:S24 family peptidase [Arcobacter peruensis]|uniref:S24 family peptidase n=1 Tax=Arcobacter peruensis TaxID=2320140 RepID=UPI000F0766C5|nr:S24 family peptidase [Arcobacter peruensis]
MKNLSLEYIDIFDDNKTKNLTFSKHLINQKFNENSLFVTIVNGKSMQTVINDKALIVSDLSNKTLEDNGIYLLYYENEMWVKQYDLKNKNFISINPDFSHLVYKENDINLVAKVLITFTNL